MDEKRIFQNNSEKIFHSNFHFNPINRFNANHQWQTMDPDLIGLSYTSR